MKNVTDTDEDEEEKKTYETQKSALYALAGNLETCKNMLR